MIKPCGSPLTIELLKPRHWFSWIALGFSFIVSLLPTNWRHSIGRKLGKLIYIKNKKRQNIVKKNLMSCFPHLSKTDLDKMTLQHLEWYGCALIDYNFFFFSNQKRLSNILEIDGREHIDNALNKNQNIIIMLAHSVMLEFAPAALGIHYDCFGSYKSFKNPVIDWMIARSRCRHVKFVVSREEGMRKLVKSLIPNQLLIFLPDEDLGEKHSVFAPFFGQQKATLTTPARLAKLGKATCLPTFAWYDPDTQKYRIQILPPLENPENDYPGNDAIINATTLNQSMEELIKKHPEQYMWNMKLFKTRPENEKPLY